MIAVQKIKSSTTKTVLITYLKNPTISDNQRNNKDINILQQKPG